MTWVKLDDAAPLHPKLLRLSDGAFRLWLNGLSFANRGVTDGKIDRALVPSLNHHGLWSKRQLDGFVSELVPGLWVDHGDHYEIHNYAHHQYEATKERVERNRASERDRKRKQREDKDRKKYGTPASVPGFVPVGQVVGHPPDDRRESSVPSRPVPSRVSPNGDTSESARAPEADPPPVASHGAEAMLRSLVAPTDADAAVTAIVSETRQAAGGAPFRGTGFADRQAVQKLAEWAAATSTPPDRLRDVLVAFWAAKGTTARLSWLVEEEPGRFLGKPKVRGMAPPVSHAEFDRIVREAGGDGYAVLKFE